MMDANQAGTEYFRSLLLTVVGQAYSAAGYQLEARPVQWAGGKFTFVRTMPEGLYSFIIYQLLSYTDTEWAAGQPSRFRVELVRSDQPRAQAASDHPQAARRDLSALVVEDFGVAILPSAAHWWTFHTTQELGQALAEAGHLVVGYGIPWLAGDLKPGGG